jgi:hypothetical protein
MIYYDQKPSINQTENRPLSLTISLPSRLSGQIQIDNDGKFSFIRILRKETFIYM